MVDSAGNRLAEAELVAEFDGLFPQGFAGADVLHEWAPEGWENSPFVAVNHPSVEQCYQEAVDSHRNLCSLRRPDDSRPMPFEPTWEEVAGEFKETPIETDASGHPAQISATIAEELDLSPFAAPEYASQRTAVSTLVKQRALNFFRRFALRWNCRSVGQRDKVWVS